MSKLFGECANCKTPIIGGVRDGNNRFCSKICRQFFLNPGFCQQCIADTTTESVGGTFTVNVLFGTRLMGWGAEPCPRCYAKVMRKWFWVLIPLIPVSGKFRVLYQTPKRYLSRRLQTS
jgi:hypothetical protein